MASETIIVSIQKDMLDGMIDNFLALLHILMSLESFSYKRIYWKGDTNCSVFVCLIDLACLKICFYSFVMDKMKWDFLGYNVNLLRTV